MARAYKTILVRDEGAVTHVTLNRPERRNAIGGQMVNELLYALRDAGARDETRAVVLTGAGKAFCAGGDFSQMQGGDADELPVIGDYPALLLALLGAPKPVIARVNGHAMGGGLGLVAASTFAVASTEAQLGTPEIDVGLFPMMIMAVLARHVPRRRLVELMVFGERLSADEAARLGLVNRAVAPDALDATVAEWVEKISSKSPVTVRLGLEAFFDQDGKDVTTALPLLQERLGRCLATDDAREGLAAVLEKRPPRWTGK
ncbi:MAG: enoyl-CoA hydratase/isomerase family protein [Polyangiaceae bacterium]|nr:enoyl-CoA hydratase/isomerase family protein [Polyangiaceae bacterium]